MYLNAIYFIRKVMMYIMAREHGCYCCSSSLPRHNLCNGDVYMVYPLSWVAYYYYHYSLHGPRNGISARSLSLSLALSFARSLEMKYVSGLIHSKSDNVCCCWGCCFTAAVGAFSCCEARDWGVIIKLMPYMHVCQSSTYEHTTTAQTVAQGMSGWVGGRRAICDDAGTETTGCFSFTLYIKRIAHGNSWPPVLLCIPAASTITSVIVCTSSHHHPSARPKSVELYPGGRRGRLLMVWGTGNGYG